MMTSTGNDLMAAIQTRLQAQGSNKSNDQIMSIVLDVMTVINTDSDNVLADALTEIANNPQPPFVFGV